MSVEVNHGYVAVDFIQGSKGWKGNTVVTTQTQQLGLLSIANVRLRIFGWRRSMCEVSVCLGHLPQGQGIVKWCDGYIATVDHFRPLGVRIDAGSWIVASEAGLAG